MKKFLLLLLVLAGTVCEVRADGELYLRSDLKNGSWTENLDTYLFTKTWVASEGQDVYEFTVNSTHLKDNTDFYFRLYRAGTNYEVCPYTPDNKSYLYQFSNGQCESYTIGSYGTINDNFKGTTYSFGVGHSAIKANSYKITVYMKYPDNSEFQYWIKVEIVDMPLTVSAGKATFSCDRALNFTGTGVNAYALTTAANGVLTKSAALTTVPANTGLYIEAENGTYNIPVIATSEASDIGTNLLLPGTGSSVSQTEGSGDGLKTNYVLTNKVNTVTGDNSGGTETVELKFYKVNNAGNTVPKGKAYLQLATPNGVVPAPEYLWFDTEITGIKGTSLMNKDVMNNEVYNLHGQRVSQPTKGLYIVGGRKVMVR